jgi:hypothetical protein
MVIAMSIHLIDMYVGELGIDNVVKSLFVNNLVINREGRPRTTSYMQNSVRFRYVSL